VGGHRKNELTNKNHGIVELEKMEYPLQGCSEVCFHMITVQGHTHRKRDEN
jgi:hypothetical protein